MAIHTVRDYITQNITTVNRQWVSGYILTLFLRRILGYSYVGDTNYPINAVGTLLIATPDSTPTTATPTFAVGTKAAINQGTSREFYVWVPPSVRTVSIADVGRIIVLKSTANPTFNSGIFVITGFEAQSYTVQTTSGNAVTPITITTTAPHTMTTGQIVTISGVTGNTNANGTWAITSTGSNTFTIPATGNGTGSSGTIITNSYIIDYRTMGTTPPQESIDSLIWYLYEKDTLCPISGTVNSGWPTTYGGNGNSTTPRIILQSPHALGWQVRICNETYQDYARGTNTNGSMGSVPVMTASPGFGGNSSGDFAIGGPHLHTALFYSGTYDASAFAGNTYIGSNCPGFGEPSGIQNSNISTQYRITIVGDDGGQGVAMFARRQFNATNPRSYMLAFGLPENEPTPLPVNNAARLFILGSGISGSNNGDYGNSLNNIFWSTGLVFSSNGTQLQNNTIQGVSQSVGGIPCSCVPSLWTYTTGVGQTGSPIFDGSASDAPFANATELFPVELFNGTFQTFSGAVVTPTFPLEPRVIGTIPHLREGRTNFDEYSTSNDPNRAWQHMRNGIYVTWNGPQVMP